MTDRDEKIPCPRCGAAESTIMFEGKDYLYGVPGDYFVSTCRACGLMYQNPRPARERALELYPQDYGPHTAAEPPPASTGRNKRYSVAKRVLDRIPAWKRWCDGVDLIPDFIPGGYLLEIGCASGARLLSLKNRGWQHLRGIELVPSAAERARAAGFGVDCDPVEDALARFPEEFFDVVIASMVLEHLFNPFHVVQEIAGKLKKGGQLLFSTVVCDSLDARIYRGYFGGFDLPRHMVFFKKRDIFRMLERDFTGIECFHQNAPIDFVRSSTWRRGDQKGDLFDRLVLSVGDSRAGYFLGLPLAWLGLTCRVSFRCRKRREHEE